MEKEPSREWLLAALEERDAQLGQRDVLIATLTAANASLVERVAELERRLAQDSSTSSRPPSSDGPYTKPKRRSGRGRSGRRPGKQPGEPGTTLCQVVDPDEVVVCEPARCADCGGELAYSEPLRVAARQVFDVPPPPPRPHVTEYRVVPRRCACGTVTAGAPPAWVVGPAGYGPELATQAANMLCGHYLPVGRSAELLAATLGVTVSDRVPGRDPPAGGWRTRSCPGSATCCAPRVSCTSMRRRAGPGAA